MLKKAIDWIDPAWKPIEPRYEMGAYESLWLNRGVSFKSLADKFKECQGSRPSDFVSPSEIETAYDKSINILENQGVKRFGLRIHGAGNYPNSLRDAKNPVELLYYQGTWELIETKAIAVVGTRKPSREGILRATKLARLLVENDFTVVSGLAAGIDTAAHIAAIKSNGRTVAVIGTPIGTVYPRQNDKLQAFIATQHLLISQVPILRYERQSPRQNRFFFPERNKTMSALTSATIIVEAGETSGTLTQARAALQQGRKVLILDNLFRRNDLTWPENFLKEGAIRINNFEQVLENV